MTARKFLLLQSDSNLIFFMSAQSFWLVISHHNPAAWLKVESSLAYSYNYSPSALLSPNGLKGVHRGVRPLEPEIRLTQFILQAWRSPVRFSSPKISNLRSYFWSQCFACQVSFSLRCTGSNVTSKRAAAVTLSSCSLGDQWSCSNRLIYSVLYTIFTLTFTAVLELWLWISDCSFTVRLTFKLGF